MGKGFQERINAIVDSIVSSEKEKNKKIDKDSISDSIKLSISDLNDMGQILVLEDLEKEAGQTPSNLLTIDGRISEEKLRNVVESKIKEAEKEGLDLRNGQDVFKNSKSLMFEGVLTLAVIDTMIKNYDNLSDRDVQILIKNYSDMSPERQDAFNKAQANQLRNIANGIEDEATKKALQEQAKATEELRKSREKELKDFKGSSLEIQIDIIRSEFIFLQDAINRFNNLGIDKKLAISLDDKIFKELQNLSETQLVEILSKKTPEELEKIFRLIQGKKDEYTHQATVAQNKINSKEDSKNISEEEAKLRRTTFRYIAESVCEINSPDRIREIMQKGTSVDIQNDKVKQTEASDKKEAFDIVQISAKTIAAINLPDIVENKQISDLERNQQDDEEKDSQISQEIQQLPITLAERFTSQEISDALGVYNEFFSGLNNESINAFFTDKTEDELKETLSLVFTNFEESLSANSYKILQELAQNDFGGNLQQILTNPELLQETFLPAIEAEIQKLEQPERAGSEQDEQSFEESEPAQPQEQISTSFNQETIRDELSAIPVALLNIDGIDRADIISGMQGYKQLLDSIDVNSLQGKSNDEVLQILMSKTAEIGLEGNANEILLMMSQIGFSKDGNMQIADILTTSKDVFTALVDEASKEENINKAIQENQTQMPITDREATPGMRLLIEDLSFAKENENQLGDQVVANDGNVSDSVSSSDTDAAQGTTSTGKLKVSAIEKHVQDRKMSGITSQFDLISEIIKNEEKGKDSQEQETTEGPEV